MAELYNSKHPNTGAGHLAVYKGQVYCKPDGTNQIITLLSKFYVNRNYIILFSVEVHIINALF